MSQISPHVYQTHIPDTHAMHPGGTNIFFVGDPSQDMIIVDAGEQERSWTHQILDYWRELGAPKISAIVITHGHRDHTGGVDRVQEAVQAPVRCHPKLVKELRRTLSDDLSVVPLRSREVLKAGGGTSLRALFTPGHAVDHVCYYLASEKVLFTGDTILGASSSSVADLHDYMKSLALLSKLKVEIVAPAHGPVVLPPRGGRLAAWYISHRNEREQQVLASLGKGITDVDQIVKDIYPRNLKKDLRQAAARNVRTHLDKLKKEGRVTASEVAYTLVKK